MPSFQPQGPYRTQTLWTGILGSPESCPPHHSEQGLHSAPAPSWQPGGFPLFGTVLCVPFLQVVWGYWLGPEPMLYGVQASILDVSSVPSGCWGRAVAFPCFRTLGSVCASKSAQLGPHHLGLPGRQHCPPPLMGVRTQWSTKRKALS